MDILTKWYVKAQEFRRGQTMVEYALILAAVAIVVFVAYQTMGTTISGFVNAIDSDL
jgi:Flp pilus assembly pilin Flp